MENGNGKLLYFSFFLLLLLFFVTASSLDNAANGDFDKVVLDLQKPPWEQRKASCDFRKPLVEKGATTLQMRERDYCSSKVADWSKNRETRIMNDVVRVQSLQARFKSPLLAAQAFTDTQIPLSSGARLNTLEYIVTVTLGGRNFSLAIDTGSDLTWVQCLPCRTCYSQHDPLFDPSSSPSYRPVLCNSAICSDLQVEIGNTGTCRKGNSSSCTFATTYADGSHSRGELSLERLTFGNAVVENFTFGCARDSKGMFHGFAGVLGLSRSNLSIVYQTSSVFGQIFSHCMPSNGAGGTGSLTMGAGDFSSLKNVTPISYTRMINLPEFPGFYFLNVTGISVGGVKLDVPRFGSRRDMNIIDSGTVITRLPPMIYKALKAEFEKQFAGFPKAPWLEILNTCYNLSGLKNVTIPTIKFHFEGNADLTVEREGVFYYVRSDYSQMCLAMASLKDEEDIGIIGNYQQINQRVVYDLKESRMGFAIEPCSF